MKGKIITVTMLSLILISVQTSTAVNIQTNDLKNKTIKEDIIIVDKNGYGDYSTINNAIRAAHEGSTITIKPGKYSEILSIDKKITLTGVDKDSTIINPISKENKYAIQVKVSDVKIENLSKPITDQEFIPLEFMFYPVIQL